MKVECFTCKIIFNKKPSECGTNNFCSKACYGKYRSEGYGEDLFLNKFVKNSWTNMNVRAGSYKHLGNAKKNSCYEGVEIKMTRSEFRAWCKTQLEHIKSLTKPSINRKDPTGHYEISNLEIVELLKNISARRDVMWRKDRRGGTLRHKKWYVTLQSKGKSYYLGSFKTKIEAEEAFRQKFIELHNKEPW